MKRSRKLLVIGASIVIVAIPSVRYLTRPDVLAVDTALVATRPLESVVEAYGRTRVRERFLVVAPVSGRVERIVVLEGTAVRAGEVVARLLPLPIDSEARTQAAARIDAAAAITIAASGQVRLAKAALEQRRRELSRATHLVAAGAMAPRVAEEAQLAVVDAEEQARGAAERLRAADADLRLLRAVLDARVNEHATAVLVRAPASGRVLRVPERSERIVAAGTPLLEVGDPQSIEVVADLLSSDVRAVGIGDRVRFPDFLADGDLERARNPAGRVRSIEPSGFTKLSALGIEEQRVNVVVDIAPVPAGLGDGHRVGVAIIIWSSPATLAVPRSALVPGDAAGTWTAFVIREGAVERRQVRVGHFGGADAEVLGGLDAGDQVVVFPSDRIREGARVAPRAD
jgi:HlyD family secretion protein